MIMSSFLSNAAVAVVFTPIAISLSYYSGIDPRPLIFAVCLGSSNSFLTPIGYQTNMMVYGPGQYKFNDFMKDLQALLILINKETKSIMIPICLSHSPINPNKDFIVVFRTHENVQSLSLDGWFTTNIV